MMWATMLMLVAVVVGCKSKFEKLRLSNDTAKKYQEAVKYYNNKRYSKALVLFDDLLQRYRGMSDAEDLTYYHAYTNYRLRDYTTARYQFSQFTDTYPSSSRAEECRFMAAYCYYLESPTYTLDQSNTLKAIESLQLFINLYPKSDRAEEAGDLIANLRDKLERKALESAKLYLDMGMGDDYPAAVIAFDNALRDYPDTKYGEEMEFLAIKSQYLYADNSKYYRQEDRFDEVMSRCDKFAEHYPKSKYLKEAEDYKKSSEKGIDQAKRIMAQFSPEQIDKEKKEQEARQKQTETSISPQG
ncbi:Beta-barrel assembly machine subunit BamD [bacterium A37T11]|nr:Beta-barrel assembly machine subunit BamD [bacterium A37T11]